MECLYLPPGVLMLCWLSPIRYEMGRRILVLLPLYPYPPELLSLRTPLLAWLVAGLLPLPLLPGPLYFFLLETLVDLPQPRSDW